MSAVLVFQVWAAVAFILEVAVFVVGGWNDAEAEEVTPFFWLSLAWPFVLVCLVPIAFFLALYEGGKWLRGRCAK